MSLKIPKVYPYQLLFALCIIIPYFNNYELTFALWSFATVFTITLFYSKDIVRLILCYIAIILISVCTMLVYDYEAYFIIRDITYLLKPIMGLMIGYQLCKKNFSKAFQTIVYVSLLIAIAHILKLIFGVVVLNVRTVNDLRLVGGYFSDYEIYAIIILIFHKEFELGFSKKKVLYFSIIIGLSAFLYLARTNFIQFIILLIAMKGYFKINKQSIIVISTVILSGLIFYSAILYINPKRNGQGIEALLYKIKIAPIEPFKTRINVDDYKDFNDNYRSYENIHTIKQVTQKGTGAVLFGEGLGSRVDLKREVWLGDMMLRFISFLHNGFMTVFLKSGLFGILIYIYSIYLLFKKKKSNENIIKKINLLMVGTGIFMIFSSWVFMGLFNLLDSKSILIGLFFAFREIKLKQGKDINLTQ